MHAPPPPHAAKPEDSPQAPMLVDEQGADCGQPASAALGSQSSTWLFVHEAWQLAVEPVSPRLRQQTVPVGQLSLLEQWSDTVPSPPADVGHVVPTTHSKTR